MSGIVNITLDTTPPSLRVETISGTAVEQTLTVLFSTSEPATVTALLRSETESFEMTVIDNLATFDLLADFETGDYEVVLSAIDEVGNIADDLITPVEITPPVSYVEIVLDTTPPRITIADIPEVDPGQRMIAEFEIDEPGAVSATLRSFRSVEYRMTIAGETAFFDVPEDFEGGDYTVVIRATDSVGNTGTASKLARISGAVPKPPPEVGGARPVSVVSLRRKPEVERHEEEYVTSIVGHVRLVRVYAFSIPGSLTGAKEYAFETPGSMKGAKEFEFSISGHRNPALHFARVMREDEELLLLM